MILRRITMHIRSQNWFAVMLDLVVVVVGIYIGLQADAWMSARQDRTLETEYLQRLLSDMEESISAQRELIEYFDESIVATDYIASFLRSGDMEAVDREKLTLGINSIGWVAPPVTNMVTIRELQSSGNIALIRDVSVRMAIGSFERSYAGAEFSALQNVEFIATASPEVMSWTYMRANVPGAHRSVSEEADPSYGYTPEFNFERMLQNPEGPSIASWVSGWSKYHGAVLVDHHEDTIAFRDLLRAKLDNNPS